MQLSPVLSDSTVINKIGVFSGIKTLLNELFQELLFCDKVLDKIEFVHQYQEGMIVMCK